MSTYQDYIVAQGAASAFALSEAAGTDFAPYIGGTHLTGSGAFSYQQAGPFSAAFGLNLHVGAKLALPFVATVNIPVSFECWYKLALPLAASQYLFYNGAAATNGNGMYVKNTDSHIHYFAGGGITDTDLGIVWPDSNWHLFTVTEGNNITANIYIDGVLQLRTQLKSPIAPNPNTLFIGGESGSAAAVALTVAMPDWANLEYSAPQAAAAFQAATDPNGALLSGGGLTSTILQQILRSVRKTY